MGRASGQDYGPLTALPICAIRQALTQATAPDVHTPASAAEVDVAMPAQPIADVANSGTAAAVDNAPSLQAVEFALWTYSACTDDGDGNPAVLADNDGTDKIAKEGEGLSLIGSVWESGATDA